MNDTRSIRSLIYQVGINPMSLNWERFIVAVDQQGRLVGCGQIKQHRDGSRELASIAVQPEWRGQGVASIIIRRLLEQADRQYGVPLYLTCRAPLGSFYERFGFHAVAVDEMPPYFRRISTLVSWFSRLAFRKPELLVMVRRV